mgnify:CR=1 FL=1
MDDAFPAHVANSPFEARTRLQADLEHIRRLRNRVAHHEPVFYRDLIGDYERMEEVVRWRCPHTAGWLRRTQAVTELFDAMP